MAGADISNRTVAWTKWDQMVGVLSDGRGVGLKDGKLHYADAKGQLHLFNSGWTPTVDDAWLQGNRAYGVRYSAEKGGAQFFDLGSVGSKGTIIMGTKAKKAWWVSVPGKALAMRPTIGSNRVVWPWLEMGRPSAVANRQISVFDAGKLRKLAANGNPQQAFTNGGADAYSAIEPADGRDSFAAMRVR